MDKKIYRNTGLDVIRCVALFCVVALHFFVNTGFYKETVAGSNMLIMTIMRNSFLICVPLFMMLTGYLIRSKDISIKYYIKLVRVLFIYVIASLLCVLFKIFILNTELSVWEVIGGMFSFKNAPYSWYIEMYIGMFLIIPFLNILYDELNTKKAKRYLLITLCILTILPSVMNIFCIAGLEWWLVPSSISTYNPLVPQWWIQIYPITYFYIGRYLREYPLKLKPFKNIILIILVFGFAGIFNYYRSYNSVFICGPWQEYGSLLVTVQTVLVFSLFSELKYERVPQIIKNIIAKISELSLGAYLTSWIFDQIVYTKLNDSIFYINYKLKWFFVTVPIVLIGSLMLSFVINYIYNGYIKMIIVRYIDSINCR